MDRVRFASSLVVAVLVVAGHASAAVLIVDRDRVQCPTAGFTSIQEAVNAAGPGDTVQVCPDVYAETVVITKPLTLLAPGQWGDCLDASPAEPTRDAIVQHEVPFNVAASNVVIDGFVVQAARFAVFWNRGSNHVVRNTLFQSNFFGLDAFRTAESLAELNCFRDNALGVAASGVSGLVVSDNVFTRNTYAVQQVNASTLEVRSNESVGDNIFVFLARATAGTEIVDNDVTGAGAGVQLGSGNSGVLIARNHLQGGAVAVFAPSSGIVSDLFLGPVPQQSLIIRDNEIISFAGSGIEATPGALVDSEISGNDIRDNGQDGIRIWAGTSSRNLITANKLKRNAEHDCHDDTVGSGTAGTANTWSHNKGKTENRPGLCEKNQ